jgi:hypothetical protein
VDEVVDDEIPLKFGPSAKIYLHKKDKIRIIHFVTEKFGTSHEIIHAVSINGKCMLQESCKRQQGTRLQLDLLQQILSIVTLTIHHSTT